MKVFDHLDQLSWSHIHTWRNIFIHEVTYSYGQNGSVTTAVSWIWPW